MKTITQKLLAVSVIALLSAAHSTAVLAQEKAPLLDKSKFSIGAGFSLNSVSGPVDDEAGFQFFGAYDLTQLHLMDGVDSSVEVGYMDYGFDGRDTDGIWATMVVDGAISNGFGWLGRLGFDFGDDSGLMVGVGAGYAISSQVETRLEYVVRDDIDSLQFNILFRL